MAERPYVVVHSPLDRLCVLAHRLHREATVVLTENATTVRTPRATYSGADIAACTRLVERELEALGVNHV